MPFNLTIFRYDCITANFAKGFLFLNQQDRQSAPSQLLSAECCNHLYRKF